MFSLQKRCLAGSLHNRHFNYKEKIINIRFTNTKNPALAHHKKTAGNIPAVSLFLLAVCPVENLRHLSCPVRSP